MNLRAENSAFNDDFEIASEESPPTATIPPHSVVFIKFSRRALLGTAILKTLEPTGQ